MNQIDSCCSRQNNIFCRRSCVGWSQRSCETTISSKSMFFRAKSSNNCNCLSPAWEVSFPFSRHKHTTKISAAISSVKLAPAEHGSCLHRHNRICFTVSSQLLPSQSSVTEAVPRPCHKCSESHALVRRLAAGQTPEATRSVMSVHRKWIQTSERTKRTRRARHMDLGHLGM